MKLYLAYIPLFLITYQNLDREKEASGKYIGYFLGEHKLIIKGNGKFVRKGFSLVPRNEEFDPTPGNMPSPIFDTKKRRFKTRGSWIYFKKDSLDGILLKTTNHIDSLYFLENGNLSPNNPNANNQYVVKAPDEFVKQ